jgi:hypothetical protein
VGETTADKSDQGLTNNVTEGMPNPDDVMSSVTATQTAEEGKDVAPIATTTATPPSSRWAPMDKFIAGSGAAARAVGKGFNDVGKGLGAIGRKRPDETGVTPKDAVNQQSEQSSLLQAEDDAASETSEVFADDLIPPEGGILLNPPTPNEGVPTPTATGDKKAQPAASIAKASASQRKDLEAKIVREMCRELGSGEHYRRLRTFTPPQADADHEGAFFYSHEVDLSHTLQHKRRQLTARHQSKDLLTSLLHRDDSASSRASLGLQPDFASPTGEGLAPAADITSVDEVDEAGGDHGAVWVEPDVNLPLWRRFDQRFFWNSWLIKEFIDIGVHEYVLPLMQGWVQSSRFYIPPAQEVNAVGKSPASRASTSSMESLLPPPSTPVDLVVISRRSKDRAGLRFQRRGIDDQGSVANFVESEMIIRVKVSDIRSLGRRRLITRQLFAKGRGQMEHFLVRNHQGF